PGDAAADPAPGRGGAEERPRARVHPAGGIGRADPPRRRRRRRGRAMSRAAVGAVCGTGFQRSQPAAAGFHVRGRVLPRVLVVLALAPGACSPATPPRAVFADPELSAATGAARAAFDRGQAALAADLYQRALTRARATDRPGEIADASYNRAVVLMSLGRYDEANELLGEAEAEARRAGRPAADVLLVEAKLARLRGRPREAVALADRVLAQRPRAGAAEEAQAHLAK